MRISATSSRATRAMTPGQPACPYESACFRYRASLVRCVAPTPCIADTAARLPRIHRRQAHQAACLLQPQYLLALQGAHRRDRTEVVMERRRAHVDLPRERFDRHRVEVVVANPGDGARRRIGHTDLRDARCTVRWAEAGSSAQAKRRVRRMHRSTTTRRLLRRLRRQRQ